MMFDTKCARYIPTFWNFLNAFNRITKVEEVFIVNIFLFNFHLLTFLRSGKFDKMCVPKKVCTLRFLRLAHL